MVQCRVDATHTTLYDSTHKSHWVSVVFVTFQVNSFSIKFSHTNSELNCQIGARLFILIVSTDFKLEKPIVHTACKLDHHRLPSRPISSAVYHSVCITKFISINFRLEYQPFHCIGLFSTGVRCAPKFIFIARSLNFISTEFCKYWLCFPCTLVLPLEIHFI